MKRFGVPRYHWHNVRRNWSTLLSSTKTVAKEVASDELEHLVLLANQSLLSLDRWLKKRDRKKRRTARRRQPLRPRVH